MRIISMLLFLQSSRKATSFCFQRHMLQLSNRSNAMSTCARTRLSDSRFQLHSEARACTTIDLDRYITDIQDEVESQHGHEPRTIRAKLRPQNQKPILRTLLGIPSRDAFEEIIRTQVRLIGHERMKRFCTNVLRPRIHSLPQYLERKDDYLPHFDSGLETAIRLTNKGSYAFNRVSSGRKYKGQMLDMLSDLCPDLVSEYQSAIEPLTEQETYLHVIDHLANQEHLDIQRVEAAKMCVTLCQKDHYDSSHYGGIDGEMKAQLLSKTNGLLCEQSCIEWLNSRILRKNSHDNNDDGGKETSLFPANDSLDPSSIAHHQPIVLPNVMVNSYQTKSRPKYKNDNIPDHSWNILWTSSERQKVCSEFDAVVLQPHFQSPHKVHISEIWEAKSSLSPSSIHDLLTKKLPAIQTILDDDEVTMSLHDPNMNENYSAINDDEEGFDLNHRELHQIHKDEKQVTFGIYGMDVLAPSNAVGQLRSTAVSYALSSDLNFAMRAVEKGYAEIELDCILNDLEYLRQKLTDGRTQFNIVAKVASTSDAMTATTNDDDSENRSATTSI